MGVFTYTEQHTSPIPPARAFKAMIFDVDKLMPKLVPQAFKSIEVIQGDGGARSVKQINFAKPACIVLSTLGPRVLTNFSCCITVLVFVGTPFSSVTHLIDEIDEEKYKYCYTLIEGDVLAGKLEKIAYEIQLVPTANGGTITKTTSKYYTLGDAEINKEEIKGGMEKAGEMFKVVEEYLISKTPMLAVPAPSTLLVFEDHFSVL
ncbi:major strawberry allergen Fra a 1.06-like [Actinidia eriantha]|uniref:major strawberry allergen Fra a 1.06-like n=1 Tax=Actinidia eriantha TaxID=165200 RepID=UPI00258D2C86|nr:major strawberry allergen Fra a 1.06-like [Actinidia eriantha]